MQKSALLLFVLILTSLFSLHAEEEKTGLDKKIDEWVSPATNAVESFIFYPIQIPVKVKDGKLYKLPGGTYFIESGKIEVLDLENNQVVRQLNGDSLQISGTDIVINGTDSLRIENRDIVISGDSIIMSTGGFLLMDSNSMNSVITPLSSVSLPIVLIILIGGALFFTFYYKFVNVRRFKLAIDIVRGKYSLDEAITDKDGNPINKEENTKANEVAGEVSHFQALTAALSATVGLGNIAGVAIAIAIGGPGATLWMIAAGLLGMSTKFVECTLGVKYREVGKDGRIYGGPMYYLTKGLKERGFGGLGKVLAIFFAIMCVGGSFGGGNMFQANQAAAQFTSLLGLESGAAGFLFGLGMAVLVAIVIIGGIRRIGMVTEKVVPFMAIIYVGASLIIIFANISAVPKAFSIIFSEAFQGTAVVGGIVGVLVQGFRRAAFSNEAGVGSAAIAHSAVKTDHPVSEGIVALLEPFADTVVICTMTALVIIITNLDGGFLVYGSGDGLNGVTLTSTAFDHSIPGFSIILTIAVILFAFSTMLSWSYYGLQSWLFLFGKNVITDTVYKVLFCSFIVIGAAASLDAVFRFSDAMIFAMVVPNIIGLMIMAPVVKKELNDYVNLIKSGILKKKD
jgi:AGCS family alanine or glycine:cation symporter